MKFPHVSSITDSENLLFFDNERPPSPCAFCASRSAEPPIVRSAGSRIDVYYLRGYVRPGADQTYIADPICWTCVQDRTHGRSGANQAWRNATARFLNALHASDPSSYYCALRSLD